MSLRGLFRGWIRFGRQGCPDVLASWKLTVRIVGAEF